MQVSRRSTLLGALGFGVGAPSFAQTPASRPDVSGEIEIVRAAYRFLHENPEPGNHETQASAYVRRSLRALGGSDFIEFDAARTAVIARYDTGRPGPTICLRAELDALTIRNQIEPETHDPRSTVAGVMHACGHDAHAAMLLGAAHYIARNPAAFAGSIVFLFQPAEETAGGGDVIANNGVLSRLGVQAVFAQHVASGMPVGQVSLGRGALLAGSNNFTLTITGDPSHAAWPQQGDDLPWVAAQLIEELSAFPARRLGIANRPVVISVTEMRADSTRNQIPSLVTLTGTIRAFENLEQAPASNEPILNLLRRRLEQVAQGYGATAVLEVTPQAPPLRNDDRLFDLASPAIGALWGPDFTISNDRFMVAEDFAFYTATLPCLYFNLGIARDALGQVGPHQPDFTIHPAALDVGTALLVALARDVAPRLS